jgi:class 3 adenylate cyclase/tetratricopeptide (TPR) repeat protein
MKCSKCNSENPDNRKYCRECGAKLVAICSKCHMENLPNDKFCGECGHTLDEPLPKASHPPTTDSERKHVTVLFSDMSGYTAMTEKLDPEEVKEIMGRAFGEISHVVARYEGFIEKFIGDAVMALFGAVVAHEDDPVRAIKAAREIHDVVSSLSPQYEKRIGKPLIMHTGICTGLVITGEVNLEKGTHGVLGDTINTASRLSGLAKPGEIVISSETYNQAEGYFTFETMEITHVKGRVETVKPYKVISRREDPAKTHRISGLRAELIGRKVEMAQLQEAVTNLKRGKGSIFSIVGDAGTGKSRLIEDFKATINLEAVQWREGHAYAYSQNIPHFPLVNLLSRSWQITEGDNPEQVKKKVETRAGFLMGDRTDLVPYLGSLYSIRYPEIENVGPEYWKARLHEAVLLILANLCKQAPTIICLEDLHWADPSTVEFLRNILSDFRHPAIFLCIYRPVFSLFTSHQASNIKSYQEIRLHDLSSTDAQSMVESLLKTETIPNDLKRFIRDKVEGNPFYLEEVINSLLETAILISDNNVWSLTKPITETEIPLTVQGVISARLDRLENETKRILQEASVIGRAFFYEILKRITALNNQIDKSLIGLERLDLIRTRSLQPDLEYIFKHALTQEVVYNGLLKKERQNIHEKIGQVMEELFKDRLDECYETLAYHYKQGQSVTKAVHYLMKSGQKSLSRYSADESHQYFQEAFDLLINRQERTKEENNLLIEVILEWAVVYSRRARINELYNFLKDKEELAVSIGNKAQLGMFYVRLGISLAFNLQLVDGIRYLRQALKIGEEIGDQKVIGYACTYLIYGCLDHGLIEESIRFGKRVLQMEIYTEDLEVFRWSTCGLSLAYGFKGETLQSSKMAQSVVEYGKKHSITGCIADGYTLEAANHFMSGDFPSTIEISKRSLQYEVEPFTYYTAKTILGMGYTLTGQYEEAQIVFDEISKLVVESGFLIAAVRVIMASSLLMVMKGNLSQGIQMFEDLMSQLKRNEDWMMYSQTSYTLGKIYLKMIQGEGEKSFTLFAKNIGFLIKTLPFLKQKAEEHLNEAIRVAKEIGAKIILGQAYLDIGELRRIKGKTDEACKYINDAIHLFEECEADVFLKQAREASAKLQ